MVAQATETSQSPRRGAARAARLSRLWAVFQQRTRRSFWARYRVCLYFLVGLALVDVGLILSREVWQRYEPNDYRERVAGCHRSRPDLIVLGGSPVAEGVDPRALTGLSWRGALLKRPYNLGLIGGTTSDFWYALRHGAAVPPRLLVYGITASDLNDERDSKQGPRTLLNVADVADFMGTRPDSAAFVARQYGWGRLNDTWQLYHYRRAIRHWAADQAERVWPGSFPDTMAEVRADQAHHANLCRPDGFAPDAKMRSRRLDHAKACGYVHPFSFLDHYALGEHLKYLHRLLDWGETTGVDVVLIDMPVSADLEEHRFPTEYARYREALRDVENTHHVTVLCAHRHAVGLNEAHFADVIHLNDDGMARLSAWIRQALQDLDTRRSARP
ncbi:MAG: hypothetical protein K2R98_31150 [Gemmataceae bacterium]|nr:hypothetical protein [Gemmataceae bacterium]